MRPDGVASLRLRHAPIAIIRPTVRRCCSSEVEHSLGKGEVESSILSSSTISSQDVFTHHRLKPSVQARGALLRRKKPKAAMPAARSGSDAGSGISDGSALYNRLSIPKPSPSVVPLIAVTVMVLNA